MPKPILTLTTDFGLSGHYVGVMKGVILGICPQAQIVDISHGVTPYAIPEGAYLIAQAYRYFPNKTVHVVVVDPGVGTTRRAILAEASGQYFIAPDNGVLGMIFAREKHVVRELTNVRYFRKPVSRTFHGRDVFSPVAAHLAAGVKAASVGKRLQDYLRPDFETTQPDGAHTWTGYVLHIDHFGNIVTSLPAAEFPQLARGKFSIEVGSRRIEVLASNYAESSPGELFVIVGSGGYLEISTGQGSAAQAIGCQPGAGVKLQLL